MKKQITICLFSLITLTALGQIKVFTGGNVSVGSTSSPATGFKLHTRGNSVFTENSGTITSAAFIRGRNGYSTATTPDYTWWGSDQTGIFHPDANTVAFTIGGTKRMNINATDIQSIGNYTFSSNFGSITSAAYIRGNNDYSTATTPDYTWYNDDQTGIFHPEANAIAFSNSGTERFRLNSNGNINIGATNDPGGRVNITTDTDQSALLMFFNDNAAYKYAHTTYVNTNTSKSYAVVKSSQDKFFVYGNGQAWAYGWNTFSDATLKENVQPITSALDKVIKLNGVTYNYKKGLTTDQKQMGLIAQDVEKIIPEVVSEVDDGRKGIAYQALVSLLIEAIKEQNGKISTLETQLNYCCTNKQQGSFMIDNKEEEQEGDNKNTLPGSPQQNSLSSPRLLQNNPNPFNRETKIEYYLPAETSSAALMIFDMQGKLVKTIAVGNYGNAAITLQANELSPGMFIYSLIADGKEVDNKRMILTQ